jgi:hypothetical protein
MPISSCHLTCSARSYLASSTNDEAPHDTILSHLLLVTPSLSASHRAISYEHIIFNNTNIQPLHIYYNLFFILLSPKHNITVTCKVTPCSLVDKYQHPEKPAASTFNHVLPSVLHFLKQLVSEEKNKTEHWLPYCYCAMQQSILVSQLATCYSILDLTSVQCFVLRNTMGITVSLFF